MVSTCSLRGAVENLDFWQIAQMVDGAHGFIGAPQCEHVGAVLSGLGMAGKLVGRKGHQYSARRHVHKMHAIARAADDALIGLQLFGGLEPMVDAQAGSGTR